MICKYRVAMEMSDTLPERVLKHHGLAWIEYEQCCQCDGKNQDCTRYEEYKPDSLDVIEVEM